MQTNNPQLSQLTANFYSTLFKHKKDGIFLDVGGNQPIEGNTTLFFEKKGWRGYVIEPQPDKAPLWRKHRKAKLFPYAADYIKRKVTLSITKIQDGMSYIKTDDYQPNITEGVIEEYKVDTILISDICKSEGISKIDFLSLDIEIIIIT